MREAEDNRWKQVIVGAAILLTITALVVSSMIGWHYVPGLLGEWMGVMVGIISTPFLLEGSFFILGLVIVIYLNHRRMVKEGDDFVYLEQVEGPDVPTNLPDTARWAIYKQPPLDAQGVSLFDQAEGALAIGDFQTAAGCIGAMDQDELIQPRTLALRIALAKATGRTDLVKKLEGEQRPPSN